jgi:hypothetical protein
MHTALNFRTVYEKLEEHPKDFAERTKSDNNTIIAALGKYNTHALCIQETKADTAVRDYKFKQPMSNAPVSQ